jgi:hypothetical protein
LEELPTVEHVRLRRPDLYENWKCPVCNRQTETFNHVWTCAKHRLILANIIYTNKKKLVSLVKQYTKGNKLFTMAHLQHPSLWDVRFDSIEFTFIDLLKGVVPQFLFAVIHQFINNTDITSEILSVFYNFIYLDIMQYIWKPRCDRMIALKRLSNINSHVKRSKKPVGTSGVANFRAHVDVSEQSNLFSAQEGVSFSIMSGGSWLDFMSADNRYVVLV